MFQIRRLKMFRARMKWMGCPRDKRRHCLFLSPFSFCFWVYYSCTCVVSLLTATYPYLQEAAIKKKYGGILPRKTPLISKVNNIALLYIVSLLFKLCNIIIYKKVTI